MAQKIKNPFVHNEGFNCFGCAPQNMSGLKMDFILEGDYIVSQWHPDKQFEGYHNVLHGGIQSTLMDELASWTVYVRLETAGVTSQMHTRFLKPVYLHKGPLTLKASIKEKNKKIATIVVHLFDNTNTLCSESEIEYFIFPEEYAKRKLYYPGVEAFIEEQDS